MHDYRKLRGRIKEKIGNDGYLADILNLSQASISGKLNNKISFSVKEIERLIDLLEIPKAEIYDYFFTYNVENYSHREGRNNENK